VRTFGLIFISVAMAVDADDAESAQPRFYPVVGLTGSSKGA